ncbi:sensor histidine kinase [Psychromonas sp. CD1]|uniref:sensor histidine kinase n=1 Tax=Psychromonas sp. CD1 TaxID=1979839 RepID=UPI000B9A3FEB|nr:HAMP domain-containing sensor histidine kinase [Psychromonas sp. CD1]
MKNLFNFKKIDLSPLHWGAICCVILLVFSFYASISSLSKLRFTEQNRHVVYLFSEHLLLYSDQMTMLARAYGVNAKPRYLSLYKKTLFHLCKNNIKHNGSQQSKQNNYTARLKWNKKTSMSEMGQNSCEFNYILKEEVKTEQENGLLIQIQQSFKILVDLELSTFESVLEKKTSGTSFSQTLLYDEIYLKKKAELFGQVNNLLQLSEQRSVERLNLLLVLHKSSNYLSLFLFLFLFLFILYNLYLSKKMSALFVASLRKEVADRTFNLFENRENLKCLMHEMEATKDQLVESEKMASLGSLVSGVAHEVNTPLGIGVTIASHLQCEAQKLLEKVKGNKLKRSELDNYCLENNESCQLLLANLERAAKLISSFKLIAVDQSCDDVRTFKMSEYLQEVFLSLRHTLKNSAVSIEIKIEDPENEPLIETIPGAISQISNNLVMNAFIHAFVQGKKEGEITFNLVYEKNVILLTVSDNGLGMEEKVRAKIFEPFYTTKRGEGGSGLGLSIVYNLVVHQLKGSIKCQSTLGEGSSFLVRLPLKIKLN